MIFPAVSTLFAELPRNSPLGPSYAVPYLLISIHIYRVEVSYVPKGTGDATLVTFHYPTAMWGWASDDQLFSVETGKDTSTVRYFQLTGQTWKVVSQFSLTGLASSYHITRDERQLFRTDEGDIYLVDGKHVVRLTSHADIWWYDIANDHMYFGASNSAINGVAKIYRLKVPH